MSEAAVDNPINDDDGDWRQEIAGDDEAKLEILKGFDSQAALFDAHQELANRNWRDAFAGDDADFKAQLERFDNEQAFANSFKEAQTTIRGGLHKQPEPPAADADEATIAAYREANGIPAEIEGYLDGLPDDMVIGEEDKELVEDFLGYLHGVHAPPQIAHAALGWYNNFVEQQQEGLVEVDGEHSQATEDALRQDWGADYRANINLIGGLLDKTFGEETKTALLNARDPEGRGIFNIPEFMQGLASIARQIDPIAQIAPPGGDPQQTLNDEIAELEKYMREDRAKYNEDEKAQARLRELYEIRLQHEQAQG